MPKRSSPRRKSNSKRELFTPDVLDKTVIAIPLLDDLKKKPNKSYDVIIDLNFGFAGGREAAEEKVKSLLEQLAKTGSKRAKYRIDPKSEFTDQYLFVTLQGKLIRELVKLDSRGDSKGETPRASRAIYRIWPDFPVEPLINKSISTVKADAAGNAFAAFGENIVWAVMDSGIQETHSHFARHENLKIPAPVTHKDFSSPEGTPASALIDNFGHGTHVGGIIAGEAIAEGEKKLLAAARHRNETGQITADTIELNRISGMAPKCKLVSLKVLDDQGRGKTSNLIAAIGYIQTINGHGRNVRIHGLNMSLGYDFEPKWFACGQSPLCVEVNRLVKTGVVVVAAAGNTGYGVNATEARGPVASGLSLTINDPGNADLAITVGSTHRDMPHVYGVSYFSSKGPTGDGRRKPDLVAPGEKIISCATDRPLGKMPGLDRSKPYQYVEDSGTSMAAPHVSGVIAAFLSIRGEFIGQAEKVKDIFLSTATDLGRDIYFQGRGLVDLMRAIQSV